MTVMSYIPDADGKLMEPTHLWRPKTANDSVANTESHLFQVGKVALINLKQKYMHSIRMVLIILLEWTCWTICTNVFSNYLQQMVVCLLLIL